MKSYGLALATLAVLLHVTMTCADASASERGRRDVLSMARHRKLDEMSPSRQTEENRRIAENRQRIIERQSPDQPRMNRRDDDVAGDRRRRLERDLDERRFRDDRRAENPERRVREDERRRTDDFNRRVAERRLREEDLGDRRLREERRTESNDRVENRRLSERSEERNREREVDRRDARGRREVDREERFDRIRRDVDREERSDRIRREDRRREDFRVEDRRERMSVYLGKTTESGTSYWPVMQGIVLVALVFQLMRNLPEKKKQALADFTNGFQQKLKAF